MVGLEVDIGPAVLHLANDPTIGILIAARPGIRVPASGVRLKLPRKPSSLSTVVWRKPADLVYVWYVVV
jgi:hypothetical protein